MSKRRVTRYNDTIGPELSSGMLVLTIFIAAVIILCVYFVCNRDPDPYKDVPKDSDTAALTDTDEEGNVIIIDTPDESSNMQETEEPEPDKELFDVVSVSTADVARGYLILVNNKTAYNFDIEEEIVGLYQNEDKSATYGLATVNISCAKSVLPYLNEMIDAYYADTEDGYTVINSGYRTYEDQNDILVSRIESVGEEQAYAYVAIPGHSEHHTGYAFDLVSYGEKKDGNWLPNHCQEYGFIQRYRADKEDITGILYEYWHYRYVGIPHAEIMMNENYCMEEYIILVGGYSYTEPFYYTVESGETYAIYTVPASDGEKTEIPVPKDSEYTVSGNNVGGFIVTVELGENYTAESD